MVEAICAHSRASADVNSVHFLLKRFLRLVIIRFPEHQPGREGARIIKCLLDMRASRAGEEDIEKFELADELR
jgi:hypothetical protein